MRNMIWKGKVFKSWAFHSLIYASLESQRKLSLKKTAWCLLSQPLTHVRKRNMGYPHIAPTSKRGPHLTWPLPGLTGSPCALILLTQGGSSVPAHLQTAWDREEWWHQGLAHTELQYAGHRTAMINHKANASRQELRGVSNRKLRCLDHTEVRLTRAEKQTLILGEIMVAPGREVWVNPMLTATPPLDYLSAISHITEEFPVFSPPVLCHLTGICVLQKKHDKHVPRRHSY